jgi:HEAT repeat protein
MEWTEFLAEIADAHLLSPEQTEAFVIRLDDGNRGKSEAKLASLLNISADAFKKRMSGVYEQFTQSCPELAASENRGKLQKLRAYLRTKYSERSHKALTHPEVNNVGTIQPIPESINWREVCGKVLAHQREKQNFRRSITGRHLGHEAKNVYVKLGLVKPKEQPRRGDEFYPSADRGTLQYQLTDKEIEQEYQYDEFLEQVIEGKEKNFTIVGEPGAGKSTWLEQIALYVDNSNKGFPICISLASLGGKTLEEHLFQTWLNNALLISQCDVGITSAQKKLEELFKSGKVWLLLDGVDEMRAHESPLQAIATQLEGWGDLARVVLTCRSNVWEANPNALLNFETYRPLHFDDEQVGDFIQQWFTQEGKPELGKQLETKLDESRNDRIRDLIKNPLRLAMLCGIWYFHQGDLPKTKATLYQQYIEYFYRWKQHPQLTDDLDKQEELHTAFSKLALEAIDKKLPLRRKFVHKVMGKSLFQLARDVGWLNWVYKDAETGEDVYAFFHLTFQEYFAACAIDDWHFFLNHVPDNRMQGTYRIFEQQWKEVILLWLGREGSEDFRKQKEEFIEALIGFEDGCREWIFGYKGFYEYRSYLLAAAGIAEFRECSCADEIVKQLVKWSFGDFNVKYQRQQTFVHRQIAEAAKVTLLDTHHSLAVNALIGFLHTRVDEYTRIEAAEILGKIHLGHPEAISTLIEIMHNSSEWSWQAVRSLGKIAKGNQEAIAALVDLLHTIRANPDKLATGVEVASSLSQIEPGHPEAISVPEYSGLYSPVFQDAVRSGHIDPNKPEWITCLIDQIRSSPKDEREEFNRLWAVQHLKASDTNAPEAVTALIELIHTCADEYTVQEAVRSLGRIGKSDPEAIALLVELSCKSEKWGIRLQALQGLRYADTSHEEIIWMLIELIRSSPDEQICIGAAQSLGQVLQRYPLGSAVSALKNILFAQIESISIQNNSNFQRYLKCYDALLGCTQTLPYSDFYQAWHQTTIH